MRLFYPYHGVMKPFTLAEVLTLLTSSSPKTEAVRLFLQTVPEATSSEVADYFGWDRSNTLRRLEALEADGVVQVSHLLQQERGRPTRVWRLT